MASLYKEGMTLHKALIHNPLLKLSQFAFSPTLTNLNIRGASTYPCWTSLTFCRLFSLLLVHGVRSLYQQFTICNCLTPSLPLNFSVFFSSSHTSLSLSLALPLFLLISISVFLLSIFLFSDLHSLELCLISLALYFSIRVGDMKRFWNSFKCADRCEEESPQFVCDGQQHLYHTKLKHLRVKVLSKIPSILYPATLNSQYVTIGAVKNLPHFALLQTFGYHASLHFCVHVSSLGEHLAFYVLAQ